MSPPSGRVAAASVLQAVARRLVAGKQGRRVRPWLEVDGDATLRLDYPLDSSSVVVDVGGYKGQWASDVFARYLCAVHVFEAVPEFAAGIARRFEGNPHIAVHAVGLGHREAEQAISVLGDRSSAHVVAAATERVRIRSAAAVLQELGLDEVHLMKLNIEGAEYDLLDHLFEHGWIPRIRDLQVQFHDFVPDAEVRMRRLQESLSETHDLTYQFPFVWENWRRRA